MVETEPSCNTTALRPFATTALFAAVTTIGKECSVLRKKKLAYNLSLPLREYDVEVNQNVQFDLTC